MRKGRCRRASYYTFSLQLSFYRSRSSTSTMTDDSESLSSTWMARNTDFQFPTDDQDGARRLASLRAHWDRATEGMKNRDAWFHNKIVPMYSEPTRFYHTLVHLEEMLGYLDLLDYNHVKDYQTLVLTIFFHDVVYDPKSPTNEEDSAKLFQDFMADCSGAQNDELKSRVVQYILATKSHTVAEEDACAQLLLDIDMAVLGKEKEAYLEYSALIRREYAFVEHNVYCEKRAEVLKGFLEQPIFGTQVMRNALEEQARENLKAEIESLQRGDIPGEDG